MATWLWATLAVAAAAASTSSSTLLGEHVCHRKETYNVTMKVRSKEPVTLRTYEWCMKVPPRCSKYHTELREVDRTQVVSRDRLVEECCAGFQKDQDRCVPVADDSSQAAPAPSMPDPEVAPAPAPVPEVGAGSPYWQQLRLTDAPDPAGQPPPQFSAAAEVSAQQKGTPPAAAFPKKDTRLAKKGAPDKTAGLDKEKPLPLDALAGESRPATESPETQTSPPPSPPPLPPELDLPPLLDMPPVPAMSDHNQSLTAGSDPPGAGRSGRRRIPPENGHPLLHSDLPAIHWTERAEPGAAAHDERGDGAADHEVLTSTPRAELPPESISKDAISKGAPRKKASDVKEVPAYARKTAIPPPTGGPPAAGVEGAAAGGPEEGSWEAWGRQPVPKELQGGGEPVAIEHHVLNGRRKAAHAKRGRGEDLKSLPPGKDPGVGLLVMADPPPLPVEAPPAQPAPDHETTMPTWLPVAIGASALVVIVVVSVSAAMLARGRRRYVAGAAGGGPSAGAGTMELRSISPHSGACSMAADPMAAAPTTTVAAPVFLSPVFVQPSGAAGAEAAGVEARPGGGGGGMGGQGLLLAAVLSPSHALCSPRTSSFIDPMQAATYDVPPPPQSAAGTLRRDAALSLGVGGLQLHHMCTTPPPAPLPLPLPPHPHELQHVYEELPACWQRPPPACH
ncbi:nascent polypeptide-associated complex subunit alpha, muscle-specific form-like [Schistocerca cancellata]|uniref:nascent polypeptide-associated complex subunit alpha, muscle-specific form-like n=1 Tax=Schistocerca cancellata TaxID=274614 RepID=UPI002118E401|nr:nascent polypeptide-associated complex subunit alpha, muscle-specific form-like [Schistocerca cancellata]